MKKIYTKANTEWYLAVFKEFENSLNGQSKSDIHRIRKTALTNFQNTGFPTTGHEEWKYTNIETLLSHNFSLPSPLKPEAKERILGAGLLPEDDKTPRIVFLNGHYVAELSSNPDAESGIEILSLKQAIAVRHPLLSEHFGKYIVDEDDSFGLMNTAFTREGTLLSVGDNRDAGRPVHLIYLSAAETIPSVSFPRNLIVSGRSSDLTFIETHASLDEGVYLTNAVSEISVGENSRVERIKLQIESESAFHISAINVSQKKNSTYTDHNINFGAQLSRNNLSTVFNGSGSQATLNGLYVGNHLQHLDNHTAIDHAEPHCESHELYKGILDQKARGVFNGKIFVRPDAQKTNAIQANNCILLSDEARIDTKPQLEIFADDVKCTHGATIGQLDEDAFFYMRARGIEQSMARKMLIYAFAGEVIDRIKQDDLRQKIAGLFQNKLEKVKLD